MKSKKSVHAQTAHPIVSPLRRLSINLIFWLHVAIFLFFPLGFLIPSSVWPLRIEFHFWYCFLLFVLFYTWGSLWTLRLRDRVYAICILDTLMQRVRGYRLTDPKNYDHSFSVEFLERFHIFNISNGTIPALVLLCILLSGGLYLLKLYGVVLW